MSEISFYISQIIDGIAYGCIYGLFGLSIVFLFRANKFISFAQTPLATLCAILMWGFLKYFSFWPSFIFTLILSFLLGCILHILVMRWATEKRQVLNSSQALITLGLYIIFANISSYIMGDSIQAFPSMFGDRAFEFYGSHISFQTIGIMIVTLLLVFGIFLFFSYTNLGLKFEAVSENYLAARLKGLRISNILAIAWGFTTVIGAVGAILIAPLLFLSPAMLLSVFGYSLMAVVIGGMESLFGAFLGGVIIGVVENLSSNLNFIGSDLKFVAVAIVLMLILLVKPRGIWGKAEARRV